MTTFFKDLLWTPDTQNNFCDQPAIILKNEIFTSSFQPCWFHREAHQIVRCISRSTARWRSRLWAFLRFAFDIRWGYILNFIIIVVITYVREEKMQSQSLMNKLTIRWNTKSKKLLVCFSRPFNVHLKEGPLGSININSNGNTN